jgi:hypothetical protein
MSATPSFRYHRKSGDLCIWDHETWPCGPARLLSEAADYITEQAALHIEFQREGMEYAASLIRPKGE